MRHAFENYACQTYVHALDALQNERSIPILAKEGKVVPALKRARRDLRQPLAYVRAAKGQPEGSPSQLDRGKDAEGLQGKGGKRALPPRSLALELLHDAVEHVDRLRVRGDGNSTLFRMLSTPLFCAST